MVRVGSFPVQVPLGADVVGDPESQVAVAAEQQTGHADVAGTGGIQPCAVRQVCLVPAGDGIEGNVGIAGQQGMAGPGTRSGHGPVVAADGLLGIAHGPTHGIMQGSRHRTGRQDALRVRFALQECCIQRSVPQVTTGDFRNVDDRQAHGQVVLELAPDCERVNRMPRLGGVVQQREFYGGTVSGFLHQLVDAFGKRL